MKFFKKIKDKIKQKSSKHRQKLLEERLNLLERNFLVLLKRMLEMDGVKFASISNKQFDSKIIQAINEDNNNSETVTIH